MLLKSLHVLRVYFGLVLFRFKPFHLVHDIRGRKIAHKDANLLLKAKSSYTAQGLQQVASVQHQCFNILIRIK